jgi:hypothetical protein
MQAATLSALVQIIRRLLIWCTYRISCRVLKIRPWLALLRYGTVFRESLSYCHHILSPYTVTTYAR